MSQLSSAGPVSFVSTLQGTDSHMDLSHGNTLPLASMPWAMTAWSPQTNEDKWFFRYRSTRIQGFRATRQPSPWIGDYGSFLLMPQAGRLMLDATARSSSYKTSESVFLPHYLRIPLIRYRTVVELTPTERCALMRMTFEDAREGRIILEPGAGESSVCVDPGRGRVTGFTRNAAREVPPNFACYFVIDFGRPFDGFGLHDASGPREGMKEGSGERLGAWVDFGIESGKPVVVRIGTSFISPKQAELNLARELGERSFDEVARAGEAVWNRNLGRVRIEGASEDELSTFYSCLYRAQLFPHRFHEFDAQGEAVHYSPIDGRVQPGVFYTDNGFWDTHRTVYPLYSILFPEQLGEILDGWTRFYVESGWMPKWPSPGHLGCMIGSHIDAVFADAVVKGIGGFDVDLAWQGLRKHAFEPTDSNRYGRPGLESYLRFGYIPEGHAEHAASATMDYAFGDFCLAQIAYALGQREDGDALLARSSSYRNVFDASAGFMRGRLEDGSWREPFDEFEWGGPFVEGSAWQCSWAVPHDPEGLAALLGGPDRLADKLDLMLAAKPVFNVGQYPYEIHEMTEMALADFGQYAHSNQPVHHVLYLFAALGHPRKTQHWTRRVLEELYGAGPAGFCGDEDNGEMASWYVLSALGFFPLCPGKPEYTLTSPLFKAAEIDVGNGRVFRIEARENSAQARFVKSRMLDGVELEGSSIPHQAIVSGGTLICEMTSAEG